MSDSKAVKKHAAQHDLFNRIHSIASDEQFVRNVAERWFNNRFKVVANQRCGTWYCDPSTSSSVYAYFKSTDGHTLNWDFNLRRSNSPSAEWAERNAGFILVDSTRRGKRMPDGSSKTVPIWCSVVNRAIALRRDSDDWDENIYLPAIVSPSERSQIEAKLDDWAEKLEGSVSPLPKSTKPSRPFFIHPATSRAPEIPLDPPYTPIICLSASRWVNGDDGRGDVLPTATRLGSGMFSRTVAFDYVPGAGDDDELWGRGLKPASYHRHKKDLLSASRDESPPSVDNLVQDESVCAPSQASDLSEDSWARATQVDEAIALDLGKTTGKLAFEPPQVWVTVWVAEVRKPYSGPTIVPSSNGDAFFAVPCPRAEPKAYVVASRQLHSHVATSDRGVLLAPAMQGDLEGSPKPPTAKLDPAASSQARKVIIPVAVTLMCRDDSVVDKSVIADRLHRLVALWPDGNPPRAASKRVNDFFMSAGR